MFKSIIFVFKFEGSHFILASVYENEVAVSLDEGATGQRGYLIDVNALCSRGFTCATAVNYWLMMCRSAWRDCDK
jgi:hypothetical protein